MNWKRKAPKRQSRQAQGIMKYKTTVTPAMTEKTVSCPSAAGGVEGEAGNVSSKITTHVANKHEETVAVSSEVIKAGPALEVDESVDELENQLMQMFNSSDDATNDQYLGAENEMEKIMQDAVNEGQQSMQQTKDGSLMEHLEADLDSEVTMPTQQEVRIDSNVSSLSRVSCNILDEDLSLTEEVEKETGVNLFALASVQSVRETSFEEKNAADERGSSEPLVDCGTELVTGQAEVISSQFAKELITSYVAPSDEVPDRSVKTEVPTSCWEHLDKESNEEGGSDDDVIILEELSEEGMQLALSRSELNTSKESLLSIPDHESDSELETERFIKSVEDVLAAAANQRKGRMKRSLRTDSGATSKEARFERQRGDKDPAQRTLQAGELQTVKEQKGRSQTDNVNQVRRRTKFGDGSQRGKEEHESPSRRRIRRFMINEESRESRDDKASHFGAVSSSPRAKKWQPVSQVVEEKKGRKRPREGDSQMRSQSHQHSRDSSSPMSKIPKLAHLDSRYSTNSRKYSYKGNRLTFSEILKKEGVVVGLELGPLLKPLRELPVWVESETNSLREETPQEKEDRERRERRITRFGSSVQQLDEEEQLEWQDQEWQQLREVKVQHCRTHDPLYLFGWDCLRLLRIERERS